MLLHNIKLNENNIKFKTKLKYSNNFEFIPIKYNNNELLIQTPQLYTTGIQPNFDKQYMYLSLINIDNDKKVELFNNNLDIILNLVIRKYSEKYTINDFKKRNKGDITDNGNNDIIIQLKLKDSYNIYDQNKNKVNRGINNTYGEFIIHLNGLWIHSKNIYFDWFILQIKVNIPLSLDVYSFIDIDTDINKVNSNTPLISKLDIKIPPPPPLPSNSLININTPPSKNAIEIYFKPPSNKELLKAISLLKKI